MSITIIININIIIITIIIITIPLFTWLRYVLASISVGPCPALVTAIGETVILLTPLYIAIETATEVRGGVQQNDSLADDYLAASTAARAAMAIATTSFPSTATDRMPVCF